MLAKSRVTGMEPDPSVSRSGTSTEPETHLLLGCSLVLDRRQPRSPYERRDKSSAKGDLVEAYWKTGSSHTWICLIEESKAFSETPLKQLPQLTSHGSPPCVK